MEAVGYDVKKLPLGKLSEKTVNEGYLTLGKLNDILEAIKKTGKTTDS